MDQVRPLTSLSQDELIARIEQYVVVVELRDAEIRGLDAANSILLAERDALREALAEVLRVNETDAGNDVKAWANAMLNARAALAQGQGD